MKIRIYTDGACSGNPGPGGWGVVINTDVVCGTLSGCEKNTTNNRMELTAMLKCLEVVSTYTKEDDFEIYSDSAYVVNAIVNKWIDQWKLRGWKTKSGDDVKNRDLWEEVYSFMLKIKQKEMNVNVIKIKGHAGNTFNELVDQIAKHESKKAALECNEGEF